MIATRVDHEAGSDLRFRSVRGHPWTSRFAVGATLALVAFFAGAQWDVSDRQRGAQAGIPPHIAAAGVISTGELQSPAFPGLSPGLASPDHARRSRTARRHWWPASSDGHTSELCPMRSSSPGVLTAGVTSVRLFFLQFRTTLLSAQTGLVSSWTTTTPPPANT